MSELKCSSEDDIPNVQHEQQAPFSPNSGSKKAKLNDGSSRDVVPRQVNVNNVEQLMFTNNAEANVVEEIIITDNEEENIVDESKLTRGERVYRMMKQRVRLDSEDEQIIRDLLIADREERKYFREAYGSCDDDESSIGEELLDSNDEDHFIDVPIIEDNNKGFMQGPVMEDNKGENIIKYPILDDDEENVIKNEVIEDNDEDLVIEQNDEQNVDIDPETEYSEDKKIFEVPLIEDNDEKIFIEVPVIGIKEEGNIIEDLEIAHNMEENAIKNSVIVKEEQNVIQDSKMAVSGEVTDLEDPMNGDDRDQDIIEGPMLIDSDEDNFVEETVIIDTEEENVAEQTVVTDNEFDHMFDEITEVPNSNEWVPGSSEDPVNEIIIMTPSTSAQALLMDLQAPSSSSSYRNRSIPDRGIDDSSLDGSEDFSPVESYLFPRSATDIESDYNNDTFYLGTSSSEDEEPLENSDEITDEDEEDVEEEEEEEEEEDGEGEGEEEEEDGWSRSNEDTYSDDGVNADTPPVLLKQRPKHSYSILKEVFNREIGLTSPRGITTRDDTVFAQKFYSSLHAVFRMEKIHSLSKHRGCVNSINFHPEGHLLASGSDDTTVIIWDWARKIPLHTIKTGHKSNVFQSKFLNFNSSSQLNIVTCARDGQVRLAQCGSAGGSWSRRRLAAHGKAANKLHVTPLEPHSVLSAGEDGYVLHCDLRVDTVNRVVQVRERNAAIALYSLHGHPFDSKQLVVAGRDKFVRVYDRRKSNKPAAIYCPAALTEESHDIKKTMRLSAIHLTCAVYNHDGTEILASYSDDDIYLFNTKTDVFSKTAFSQMKEGYSLRFSGHRNSATLKGVSYFGPKSEYIISGSDCGHIYMWDKQTESIVQWRQGDGNGMVNIIEPHPRFPILASGGLDKDVKIWAPYGKEDPNYHGLSNTIRLNTATNWQSPLFNDFLPTLYRSWRGDNRIVVETEDLPYAGNHEFEANICTNP